MPESGERIRGCARRDYGSVCFLLWARLTCAFAGLPLAGTQIRETSGGRPVGDLQYHGPARTGFQRVQCTPRGVRRGRSNLTDGFPGDSLFFFNDTATTEIYTLSLPTLFR